jgi:hypothetical protein
LASALLFWAAVAAAVAAKRLLLFLLRCFACCFDLPGAGDAAVSLRVTAAAAALLLGAGCNASWGSAKAGLVVTSRAT